MAKEKITKELVKRVVKRVKETKQAEYIWDTELVGFGFRASPSGQVSWLVQKRYGGREISAKRVVIGRCPPWEVEKARAEAGSVIGEIYKGIDPLNKKQTRRKERLEAIQAPVLSKAIEDFLTASDDGSRYWHENKAKLRSTCSALGASTKVTEIQRAELRKIIDEKASTLPGAARNLFGILRPFFGWLEGKEIIQINPMHGLQAPPPPSARARKLTDEEIRCFWKATGEMGYPWCSFFRLLFLHGQRREETATMEWREIHNAVWTIPKERTKNGKEHIVHLSEQALSVLPPKGKSKLVFSTTGDTPISGYSKAKARLDARMAELLGEPLADWRTHDLRRTCASGMARIGIEPHVIERVLNHVSGVTGGLTGVYQQYEYLPERKRALEAWGVAVALIVNF